MNLSEYFTDIAYKRLSAVEADSTRSNQHEFNGVAGLKKMLGEKKREFLAKFAYLAENEPEPITADVRVTWYDARENNPNRAAEYRLYYQGSPINEYMQEGDLMVIARRPENEFYFFIAQKGSTYENQLALLFDVPDGIGSTAETKDLTEKPKSIEFVQSFILGEIGIEADQADENYLERILKRFPTGFPTTAEFSDFARSTLPSVSVKDDPDYVLMSWMEREELLFKTFERYLLTERLKGKDQQTFLRLPTSTSRSLLIFPFQCRTDESPG
jgi:hypothetical protein